MPIEGSIDRTVVRAGKLVDVDAGELLSDRAILIRGDRIEDIVAADDAPPGAREFDLSDSTVLPGLIDCHAHMIGELESGHLPVGSVIRAAQVSRFGRTTSIRIS